MAREHDAIKMTEDEVASFLTTQAYCILATLDPDGSPWGDAVACAFDRDKLYFSVPKSSRSARNLHGDTRVCCTMESRGDDYYSVRSAMVHGNARPTANGTAPARLGDLPDPVDGVPSDDAETFELELEHVVSFDFGKIQRRFEQG